MSDTIFINTPDVEWATGEDVEFATEGILTTLMFNFTFDDSARDLLFANGDVDMTFDDGHRPLNRR